MPFTENEIAEHIITLEEHFWSRHRPPVHLRDRIRESQRFTNRAIELFFIRPAFRRPGEEVEDDIAKVQHVVSRNVWRIFWKRADCKWHGYEPCPEVGSLAEALAVIDRDPHGCFFG